MDSELEIYARLALAAGLGLMVGVERGWRKREQPEGSRAAGVRTYTLIGLFGGAAAALQSDMALVAGLAALTVFLAIAYVTGLKSDPDRSLTGEIAGLLTYSLGALAVMGDMVLAAAAGAVTVAVLASRETVHAWIKRVEQTELKAAIQLLVISVVILPVLPNRGYGPGGVLNPFELWWVVVAVVGISFAAMAAVKWLGPRSGLLWTGLIGGASSSTVVAVACARMAAAAPGLAALLAASAGAATAVKYVRALFIASLITPAGARLLAPGLLAAAALTALATFITLKRAKPVDADHRSLELKDSRDLTLALSFAAFLGVVTLAAYYGNKFFGTAGLLAVSALSGLVDVDAVTVSAARQAAASAPGAALVLAVSAALAVNTIAKAVYVSVIAGGDMARRYAIIAAAALIGLASGLIRFF